MFKIKKDKLTESFTTLGQLKDFNRDNSLGEFDPDNRNTVSRLNISKLENERVAVVKDGYLQMDMMNYKTEESRPVEFNWYNNA